MRSIIQCEYLALHFFKYIDRYLGIDLWFDIMALTMVLIFLSYHLIQVPRLLLKTLISAVAKSFISYSLNRAK